MLIEIVDKQRRAVSVVRTALLSAGIRGRSVSAGFDSWSYPSGQVENYAVFISGPAGTNIEPHYETGKTIVEAVRKTIASIKGKVNDTATANQSETAPF